MFLMKKKCNSIKTKLMLETLNPTSDGTDALQAATLSKLELSWFKGHVKSFQHFVGSAVQDTNEEPQYSTEKLFLCRFA